MQQSFPTRILSTVPKNVVILKYLGTKSKIVGGHVSIKSPLKTALTFSDAKCISLSNAVK